MSSVQLSNACQGSSATQAALWRRPDDEEWHAIVAAKMAQINRRAEEAARAVTDALTPEYEWKAADIMGAPDPPDPIFKHGPVPGVLALLTAESGRSKSYLTLQLAVSLATGISILPTFAVEGQAAVLVFVYEDSEAVIKDRLCKIGKLKPGLADAIAEAMSDGWLTFYCAEDPLFTSDRRGAVSPTASFRALDKLLGGVLPDFVICDPLSGAAELADENSNTEMAAVGRSLSNLAKRHDCGFLLVHHSGKAAAEIANQHQGRGGSALASRSRWMATITGFDSDKSGNTLKLDVVKNSYHPRASTIILARAKDGTLSEKQMPTVDPLDIARFVSDWLREHPDAIISQTGVPQNRGADAQSCRHDLSARWSFADSKTISAAIFAGLKAGILIVAKVKRSNRSTTDALLPGTPNPSNYEFPDDDDD